MRILHATAYHSSLSTGGTERYVDDLMGGLSAAEVENSVLVISPSGRRELGPRVHCYYPKSRSNEDLEEFRHQCQEVLHAVKPDWIFFHTSELHEAVVAELAKALRIPWVYFFHASSWLCAHYDLQYCGREACSRLFSPWRCSICMASGKSGKSWKGVTRVLLGECQRLFRPNRESWLHSFRYEHPRKASIVQGASRVVVFTQQDKALLADNGVADDRISVIPQAVSAERIGVFQQNASKSREGCLKIGYVGRVAPIKGCHYLVQAAKAIPASVDFELHLYGCDDTTEYVKDLRTLAGDDRRILFHPMMPSEQVLPMYGNLDVLCIPSVVFETGPLTLFEGVYSGCRVYGSSQIGQREFLMQYGHLVADNSVDGWRQVIEECVKNLAEIRASRRISFDYRTMETVSREILFNTEARRHRGTGNPF